MASVASDLAYTARVCLGVVLWVLVVFCLICLSWMPIVLLWIWLT